MRKSGFTKMTVSFVGAVALAAVSCGDINSSDSVDRSAGSDETQSSGLFFHRHRPPPPPSTSRGGTSGSTGGTSGGTSCTSALTTDQVIKAAQTADGAAIPQPSGPNHSCPEVVVRLGFWSCPTIGDSCASCGRSCACQRTDGEGQFPSWVCN
jgi:hypothetical protein